MKHPILISHPILIVALILTSEIICARTSIWNSQEESPIWHDAQNWADGHAPQSGEDSVLFDQIATPGKSSNNYDPHLRSDFVLAEGQSMRSQSNTVGVLRIGDDVEFTIKEGAKLDFGAGQFGLAEGGENARITIEAGSNVILHRYFNGNNINHTTQFIANEKGVTHVTVSDQTFIRGGRLILNLENYDLNNGRELVLFTHSSYSDQSTGFREIELSPGWSGTIDYHFTTDSGQKAIAITQLKNKGHYVDIPETSASTLIISFFTIATTLARRRRQQPSHKRAM